MFCNTDRLTVVFVFYIGVHVLTTQLTGIGIAVDYCTFAATEHGRRAHNLLIKFGPTTIFIVF